MASPIGAGPRGTATHQELAFTPRRPDPASQPGREPGPACFKCGAQTEVLKRCRYLPPHDTLPDRWMVSCQACGAGSPAYKNPEDAVEFWGKHPTIGRLEHVRDIESIFPQGYRG